MLYNENVMKWCGPYDNEEYEDLIVYDEDIVIVDDSEEWYNVYDKQTGGE
jgi:hypothetical protein